MSRRFTAGAAVLLAVTLTGCSTVEQVRGDAERITGQAEELWAEAQQLGDLTVNEVREFDWTALQDYEGILLGEDSKVTEFFRSMPSGPDMESFEIRGEEGTLVVNYGDQATEVDPAVLQETMERVAAQAKERVQDLETVEFRVGDAVYSF